MLRDNRCRFKQTGGNGSSVNGGIKAREAGLISDNIAVSSRAAWRRAELKQPNGSYYMPLFLQRQLEPAGDLGIWQIDEPESYFRDLLDLLPEERAQVDLLMGRRRIEWLAGRYLLHLLSGREERGACLKDEFGKPHLENSPYQISISHSHGLAAVIAAPEAVGIDIQFLVPKIERIAYKFMRPEETACLHPDYRIEHLHVFWGAKESLYKAYGRRMLDFREHLGLQPFTYQPAGGQCRGWIHKEGYRAEFRIEYERFDDYLLVYARQE